LYRRPKILLLDEGTAHLDVGMERRINDTLRQLKITRVAIAHRPETIRAADRGFSLEKVSCAPAVVPAPMAAAAPKADPVNAIRPFVSPNSSPRMDPQGVDA